jgi:hypothetical protein
MKLKRLILLGLLISTKLLNAQTDFRPGYIIKNSGDTIYGKIDYRGDLLMSSVCKFKNSDNSNTEYFPNELIGYRFVDGKFYISKEVNNKRVFLEYLIKGKVNIYYMRDGKGDHYYLDKEGEKFTELPYNEGIKYIDNKKVLYESNKHIRLLSYYMQDAPNFQYRIQSVRKPEHHDLIKLAEDYHNAVCNDEKCIIYEKKVPFIKLSVTPFVGLTKYNAFNKLANEFGGYLYFWAPRASEKLFFKTGLAYNKISEDGVDLTGFKIPIQFQYIFRAHKLQPHMSSGVNVLSFKFEDYKEMDYTLSLNAGLNYQISNNISINTTFNSDYTPLSMVILSSSATFDLISYSVIIGLRIDL